jgi:hypothetical protein
MAAPLCGALLLRGRSWTQYAWVCQGELCAWNRFQGRYRVHKTFYTSAAELNGTGTGYVSNKDRVYCPACSELQPYANVPPEFEFYWRWMSREDLEDLVGLQRTSGGWSTSAFSRDANTDTDTTIRQQVQLLRDRIRRLEQIVEGLSGRLQGL